MNKKQSVLYALLSSIVMLCTAMTPFIIDRIQESSLAGIWEGKLAVGKNSLRIVFNVLAKNDTISLTMDSPDQGAKGFAGAEILVKNDSLTFSIPTIGGRFAGKIASDHQSIDGMWMQGPASLPLLMKRVDKAAEVLRPQTPLRPFPYNEENVSYKNKKDSITLSGTLTIPKGNGPFPAVILITGSGAQDRDESLLGHKPFLLISDYLTRRGIEILRVDDRGVGGSTGTVWKSTTANFANDVLAGIEFLKTRKEVDPKKIGALGHSEGGIIAPLVASRSSDVAFIVMLAGTGMNGEEIILLQSELISRAEGAAEKAIERERKLNSAAFAVVKMNLDSAAEWNQLRKIISDYIAALSDSEKSTMKDPVAALEAEMKPLFSPWMKFFLTYDPRAALQNVKCPVLAINGEKDLQVPPKQNLAEIEKALNEGKNKKYTIKELKGLNHLFQHAVTGSPMEYGKIEETMAPEALQMIGDWIVQQTTK